MSIASRSPSSLVSSIVGRSARLGVSAALVAAGLACRDGYQVPTVHTPPIDPAIPVYGSVMVSVVTSGESLDPDGFVVQFDGPWDYEHGPTPVATNGTATLTHLSPGKHSLTLLEVAANCAGENLNDRPILIKADTVITVSFQLVCSRLGGASE